MKCEIWLKLVQEVHMYAFGDFESEGYDLLYGMAQAQNSRTQFNLLMPNAWVNLNPYMYFADQRARKAKMVQDLGTKWPQMFMYYPPYPSPS